MAEPLDATELLGTDELEQHQNEKVSFTGLTVAPSTDANGNEAAFLYNYDGSGTQGDDVYFNVSYNGQTYSFVVESYLCGSDTEVYKAVEALEVGQTIDCEGFLYWYRGRQPPHHLCDCGCVTQYRQTRKSPWRPMAAGGFFAREKRLPAAASPFSLYEVLAHHGAAVNRSRGRPGRRRGKQLEGHHGVLFQPQREGQLAVPPR